MPDIAAVRPASGEPIASAWGGAVHDAVEGIQTGTGLVTGSAAVGTLAVVFPRAYAVAPTVVATPQSSAGTWIASVSGITTAGFNLHLYKRDGSAISNLNVSWIAIGTPA